MFRLEWPIEHSAIFMSHSLDILLHQIYFLSQSFNLLPVDSLASGGQVIAGFVAAFTERVGVGCYAVLGISLTCTGHRSDVFAEHDVATSTFGRKRFFFFA